MGDAVLWSGGFDSTLVLAQIESNYEIEVLAENEDFKHVGMPFYNEDSKTNFINVFNKKLKIE